MGKTFEGQKDHIGADLPDFGSRDAARRGLATHVFAEKVALLAACERPLAGQEYPEPDLVP